MTSVTDTNTGMTSLTSLELCAGGGGQALGLEQAGFKHLALGELDAVACETLRFNRPGWNTLETDIKSLDGTQFCGVDLLAAGVPCPPFSVAGKRLGADDERDLFPEVLRIAAEANPLAILIENVPGLLKTRFDSYRQDVLDKLSLLGYTAEWRQLQASDFGLPQLRPRAVLVALKGSQFPAAFQWPLPIQCRRRSVGDMLYSQMSSRNWEGAIQWKRQASGIAPTLVGGSKLHGGPDLGPTRSKKAWSLLGVDGKGLADAPPGPGFVGMPRLTLDMCALLQGFPKSWKFVGKKTPAYRCVGNAFPPPVAKALGLSLGKAILALKQEASEAAA